MKLPRIGIVLASIFILFFSSAGQVTAGDFDWLKDLNLRAEANISDFRARLATRFRIGDTQIKAVISNVERPADAYMVLRFAEMTTQPPHYILQRYRAERHKGWGAFAKSLGIKPGSQAFHALKRGNSLYLHNDRAGIQHKNRGNGKGKGKGRGKGRK